MKDVTLTTKHKTEYKMRRKLGQVSFVDYYTTFKVVGDVHGGIRHEVSSVWHNTIIGNLGV